MKEFPLKKQFPVVNCLKNTYFFRTSFRTSFWWTEEENAAMSLQRGLGLLNDVECVGHGEVRSVELEFLHNQLSSSQHCWCSWNEHRNISPYPSSTSNLAKRKEVKGPCVLSLTCQSLVIIILVIVIIVVISTFVLHQVKASQKQTHNFISRDSYKCIAPRKKKEKQSRTARRKSPYTSRHL